MISESRVRKLAITWYVLALHNKKLHGAERAAPLFAKAHAFIHVLGLPCDISCGKKSEDGLKRYAENLHTAWDEAYSRDPEQGINHWIDRNVKADFEAHI